MKPIRPHDTVASARLRPEAAESPYATGTQKAPEAESAPMSWLGSLHAVQQHQPVAAQPKPTSAPDLTAAPLTKPVAPKALEPDGTRSPTGSANDSPHGEFSSTSADHNRIRPLMHTRFALQCDEELNEIKSVWSRIGPGQQWVPSEEYLQFVLPRVYRPSRIIDLSDLAWSDPEVEHMIERMLFVERFREQFRVFLRNQHGIESIEVVPGLTTFVPRLHEDNPLHRLPADEEKGRTHNLVYALLRPGFIQGGKVLSKAFVKRFVSG